MGKEEWTADFSAIQRTLEKEVEKAGAYIKECAARSRQEDERKKQVKARYIEKYGDFIGTVLYNEYLKQGGVNHGKERKASAG